jgi:hypothetical protein
MTDGPQWETPVGPLTTSCRYLLHLNDVNQATELHLILGIVVIPEQFRFAKPAIAIP